MENSQSISLGAGCNEMVYHSYSFLQRWVSLKAKSLITQPGNWRQEDVCQNSGSSGGGVKGGGRGSLERGGKGTARQTFEG